MQGGVRKRGDPWYYYFEAGQVDGKRKKSKENVVKQKKKRQMHLEML